MELYNDLHSNEMSKNGDFFLYLVEEFLMQSYLITLCIRKLLYTCSTLVLESVTCYQGTKIYDILFVTYII